MVLVYVYSCYTNLCLFIHLLTAPENLIEHSYEALYHRFN